MSAGGPAGASTAPWNCRYPGQQHRHTRGHRIDRCQQDGRTASESTNRQLNQCQILTSGFAEVSTCKWGGLTRFLHESLMSFVLARSTSSLHVKCIARFRLAPPRLEQYRFPPRQADCGLEWLSFPLLLWHVLGSTTGSASAQARWRGRWCTCGSHGWIWQQCLVATSRRMDTRGGGGGDGVQSTGAGQHANEPLWVRM